MKKKLQVLALVMLGLGLTSCGSKDSSSDLSPSNTNNLFAYSGQSAPTVEALRGAEQVLEAQGIRFVMGPGVLDGQQMVLPMIDYTYYLDSRYRGIIVSPQALQGFISQAWYLLRSGGLDYQNAIYVKAKVDRCEAFLDLLN